MGFPAASAMPDVKIDRDSRPQRWPGAGAGVAGAGLLAFLGNPKSGIVLRSALLPGLPLICAALPAVDVRLRSSLVSGS